MNRQVAGKWSYRGLGWVRNIKKIYVEKCNGPHFIGDIQLMRPNESIIRCSVFGNPSFQMDLWHLFYQVSPNPPISNIIAEPARCLQGKWTAGPCWAHVALSLVPTTALQHWKNTLSEVSCFLWNISSTFGGISLKSPTNIHVSQDEPAQFQDVMLAVNVSTNHWYTSVRDVAVPYLHFNKTSDTTLMLDLYDLTHVEWCKV